MYVIKKCMTQKIRQTVRSSMTIGYDNVTLMYYLVVVHVSTFSFLFVHSDERKILHLIIILLWFDY